MSVAKVIEVTSRSPESFEDAIARGIAKAGETVQNIQAAWINQQQVIVTDNKPAEFQVDMKITFMVD